jgi:triosephosphate isomerase
VSTENVLDRNSDRRPLISGNWKMHHNHYEAIQTVQKLAYLLSKEDYAMVDVSIHPPFTDVRSVQTLIDADELRIALGAQHCHWEDKGAFTGEVSPVFLAKLGVRYVIVGHSERRQMFGETDEHVARKINAVQKHGMVPIVCVGETLEEREAGHTSTRVMAQVRSALEGRSATHVAEMVIAYEPIWAIGTGLSATAGDAQAVIGAIRAVVGEVSGAQAAQRVRIQYGGSVKAANIAEIMAQPDIDGALVGGASLDPAEFARIVQYRLRPAV